MNLRVKGGLVTLLFLFGLIGFSAMPAAATQVTLSGVPIYYWWHGCSPTSGGMLVGYYDGLAGYGDLVADGVTPQDVIYNIDAEDNSIGDFMNTNQTTGGTSDPNIASGMEDYIEWDNPDTAINESYVATTWNEYTYDPEYMADGWTAGEFTWADYVAEIDAGQPMLLSWGTPTGKGHTTIGIGYNDQYSTDPSDWLVALYTTWSGSEEPSWWHFDPNASDSNPSGWNLDLGTFVHIDPKPVPEPATVLLLGTGLGLLGFRRRLGK